MSPALISKLSSSPAVAATAAIMSYPLVRLSAYGIVLLVGYLAARIIYNVYFHPLRKYPGPTSWAATRIPWCWHQFRGINYLRLLQLHTKYGHVVRIGPNELSYTTDSAWKTIYGHRQPEMGKDPVFSLHTPTGVQNILTADRPTHTRHRRTLAHAFSEKALREQEDILQSYTTALLSGVEVRRHQPIDIGAWFMFTTFDLISDLSFGDRVGCLAKGDYDPYVSATPAISKELQYYQMLKYWGVEWAREFFMPTSVAGARQTNMKRAMSTVNDRINRNDSTDRKDFLHYILAANEDKGMSRQEIDVNAFSISTAGSESTATALAGAIFHLLQNPDTYQKLTYEIRAAFPASEAITLSATTAKSLPYLHAVLQETMRLYPPVAVTLPRRVPAEEVGGVIIDGSPVPAGTTVGINFFAAFHSPHNFHAPEKFAPERWLSDDSAAALYANDNKDVVQPFSVGPRNCLGKNLAWAEMQLVLSRLLWAYDVRWPEEGGSDGGAAEKKGMGREINKGWQSEQKLFGFWVKPPLMVCLEPVERGVGGEGVKAWYDDEAVKLVKES